MPTSKPELELVERTGSSVRYLQHGYPDPLVRWHYHEELELHLIVATQGKAFVGDYIGPFAPGHLVLTGPMLPHNWLSNADSAYCPLRDMVVQFPKALLYFENQRLQDLQALRPLLERARFGIEFLGFDTDKIRQSLEQIRDSAGAARLGLLFVLLDQLAHWHDYRLLSSERIQGQHDQRTIEQINLVVTHIAQHYQRQLKLEELAALLKMNPSYFSRFFRAATGLSVANFINRMRISRACQLLIDSPEFVSAISYRVGFNNLANFNRQFLRLKNMTPNQYRKSMASMSRKAEPPSR